MIEKIKNFLGMDIKNDKYALVDDEIFGKVAKSKKPDKWVRSTCGYCGVGCGLYIGANIADNHPILKLHIAKNKKITGKKPTIIVVDPRHSKTANMADVFVPLKPRTDLALINGLCHIIWEQGWADESFMKDKVSGYKAFVKHIQKYPSQEVAKGQQRKTL